MTQRPHDPTAGSTVGPDPASASTRRRKIVAASAAGLALAVVVGAAVGFARWFTPIWDGTPYPVADPAATARELEDHTQSAYAALGLPRAELADWPGAGLVAEGDDCHLRGMRHWSGRAIAYPPQAPGVVAVSDTWGLGGVPRAEAGPALERARKALTRQGWKVTAYETAPRLAQAELRLELPGTGRTLSLTTYPGDRLEVAAHADCARYPAGTPLTGRGDPRLPAPAAPSPLRGESPAQDQLPAGAGVVADQNSS
ncbi:hypothetical protein [Streptomyces sp. NRRL F-2580]|uniref:hypothetical protein n=1 Tax=Streptomyces sp. NRRL F-2580 TaxID=1463841 RepID=UPI0004C5EFE9|nr:hypothetical protein [Streptomyces sp. NRRL F-2580]